MRAKPKPKEGDQQSPLREAYERTKRFTTDSTLLFALNPGGGVYVLFGDDARRAAEALGLNSRLTDHKGHPMLGLKPSEVKTSTPKLVKAGFGVVLGEYTTPTSLGARLSLRTTSVTNPPNGRALTTTFDAEEIQLQRVCAASSVRTQEVRDFSNANGIRGLDPEPAPIDEALLRILAEIPYQSAKHGIGEPSSTWQAVAATARRLGFPLDLSERLYLHTTIRQRDALLDSLIERAGGATALDSRTGLDVVYGRAGLSAAFDVDGKGVRLAGDADLLAVVQTTAGVRHALVVCIKPTSGAITDVAENARLEALAALASAHWSDVASVGAAYLARGQAAEKARMVSFEDRALLNARERLKAQMTMAERVHRSYAKGRAEAGADAPLPEPVQEAIDNAATVGDHCKQCLGAVACRKLRLQLTAEIEPRLALISDLNLAENFRALAKHDAGELSASTPDSEPNLLMTVDELAQTMAQTEAILNRSKLIEKMRTEGAELSRQLLSKQEKGATLGGVVSLKEGAEKMKIREVSQDGVKIDTSVSAVFEVCRAIVPGLSKDQFIDAACEVNPTSVRDLAISKGIKADVFRKQMEALGPTVPIEWRRDKSTVLIVSSNEVINLPDLAGKTEKMRSSTNQRAKSR